MERGKQERKKERKKRAFNVYPIQRIWMEAGNKSVTLKEVLDQTSNRGESSFVFTEFVTPVTESGVRPNLLCETENIPTNEVRFSLGPLSERDPELLESQENKPKPTT